MRGSLTTVVALAVLASGCHRDKDKKDIAKVDELAVPSTIKDVTLPTSRAKAHATSKLRIYVGRRELALGSPPILIASLPEDGGAPLHGFPAIVKRSGPHDLFLVPLGAALNGKGQDDALIYVDRDTPYRVLVEVLFTLGQSELTHFHFVTTSGASAPLSTFEVIPPRACPQEASVLRTLEAPVDLTGSTGSPSASAAPTASERKGGKPCKRFDDKAPHLNLTVLVVSDGFSVKARGGNVAPGCNDVGPGLAIPMVAGNHDYKALTACLKHLRDVAPELADERDIVISANPATTAQEVFSTIDAAHDDGDGGVLFPDVMFGVAR